MTMTPEERAIKIYGVCCQTCSDPDEPMCACIREIAEAIRDAENDVLERAAAQADQYSFGETLAIRIRALKHEVKPPTGRDVA